MGVSRSNGGSGFRGRLDAVAGFFRRLIKSLPLRKRSAEQRGPRGEGGEAGGSGFRGRLDAVAGFFRRLIKSLPLRKRSAEQRGPCGEGGEAGGSDGGSGFRERLDAVTGFFRRLIKSLPLRNRGAEQLCLRLELKGKVLYETADFSATGSITIGRSSECVWVIPPEDNVASGHHAVIMMRGGRLCLRDTGSRNGIFYKAKRIQEKVLAPDDKFSIGNCTLFVERVKASRTAVHELVFLNTDRKGERLKLDRPKMVAGSAPGGDIVIDEQLVSQKHAEFGSKADGCWLRDLGSKNGTFVNGTRLSPSTERLLADDDVVSISFVDFKFVDGRVEHSQIRIWYSLGVVAATIFIVLVINWVWMGVKASSDSCMNNARAAAAAGSFDKAREHLKESRTRRGAENNEDAYHDLDRWITVWENTLGNWDAAKAALDAGNWVESSRILGMITEADPNVWGWNDTSAPLMRKEAFAVKELLDAYLLADASMRDDSNRKNPADLKNATEAISRMVQFFAPNPPPYLKKLLTDSAALRRQIDENLRYLEKLEAILARIEEESDNLAMVLGDLEELKQHAEPNIRIRIENCMVPLSMLQRAGKQIKLAMILVRRLDFSGLSNVRPDWPTLEQCAVNQHIATLRKNQERQFEHILSVAANLRPLVGELDKLGLNGNSELPRCVTVFGDEKVMAKVFACDAFENRRPARLRTEPAGEYDRVLGIDGFFEFIYSLPAPFDRSVYSECQFVPEIVRFRDLLSAIRTFRIFADQERHQWLHSGEFLRLYERATEVSEFARRLAKEYLAVAPDAPRERVLRKAIAVFLLEGEASESDVESLVQEFKNLRLPLSKMDSRYKYAPVEEKIRIRDEILRRGLPGDRMTNRMWSLKPYQR